MEKFVLVAKYAGREHQCTFETANPSLEEVLSVLSQYIPEVSPSTVKLLGGGKTIVPSRNPQQSVQDAGLMSGAKLMVLGSKAADITAVQAAREVERMPGFEYEAMRAARRRARVSRDVQPPAAGTKYTFGSYDVMRTPGLQPGPDEALKLLYRLAADPGIMSVMAQHRFSVGKLAEMPPEGLVGVSAVCVLGYNTNKGQSIHLRLRTDDLKGFRKYESIRATLVHELTHNVWGDHDDNFKQLCSQLNREVEQVHATRRQGAMLMGPAFADDEPAQPAMLHPAMAATAASSGKTLRQLARQGQPTLPVLASSSSSSSAMGTVQTVAVQQAATAAARPLLGMQPAGAAVSPARSGTPGSGSDGDDDVGTMYEHFDQRTEELERMQKALE